MRIFWPLAVYPLPSTQGIYHRFDFVRDLCIRLRRPQKFVHPVLLVYILKHLAALLRWNWWALRTNTASHLPPSPLPSSKRVQDAKALMERVYSTKPLALLLVMEEINLRRRSSYALWQLAAQCAPEIFKQRTSHSQGHARGKSKKVIWDQMTTA